MLIVFVGLTLVSAGAVDAIDTDRILGTVALSLALIALPLLLVLLFRLGAPPVPLVGAALLAVIALAVFGRFAQEDYLENRYSSTAPDYPRTEHPGLELEPGAGRGVRLGAGTARPEDRALGDAGRPVPVRPVGRGLEQ